MSTNEHTGDSLRTKPASDAYRDNYDAIFRKPDPQPGPDNAPIEDKSQVT